MRMPQSAYSAQLPVRAFLLQSRNLQQSQPPPSYPQGTQRKKNARGRF